MTEFALIIAALVLSGFALLAWRRRRWQHQRLRLQQLLDLCDSLEQLLDRSQQRMHELQTVVGRVPADIGAVAQTALESGLPIREAKRDVLQHRLWIQKCGDIASPVELDTARSALERAQARLSGQIAALESAGNDLAQATAASEEAARREPAALRRPSGSA